MCKRDVDIYGDLRSKDFSSMGDALRVWHSSEVSHTQIGTHSQPLVAVLSSRKKSGVKQSMQTWFMNA